MAPSSAELRTHVDKIFTRYDSTTSPGCALVIVKDGVIDYMQAYGMADLDHDIPIQPHTVFHAASVAKQFTGAAIVLLALDGALSLDDDVQKYVPELPHFGTPITIRHLIHHTSGLRDQWSLLDLAGWRYTFDLITDQDVLDVMSAQKGLNFPPGEQHLYCNTGYTLLAQVVKHVSGISFREFTRTRIFGPLGMTATQFRDDHTDVVKHMASGYVSQKSGSVFKVRITNFDTVGATSLLTTVEDLARWAQNFDQPIVGGPAMIQQMLQRGVLTNGKAVDYAFGLAHGTYRSLPTISHGGGDAGYRAHFLRFPDRNLTIACLCNLAEMDTFKLSRRIADQYLAAEPAMSAGVTTDNAPATVASKELTEVAGFYWQAEDEWGWRIDFTEGRLWIVLGKNDRVELGPLSVELFRAVGRPIEIVFRREKTDGRKSIVARSEGRSEEWVLHEAPEFKPTPAQLRDCAGVYRCDELELPYRIHIRDEALFLKRYKHRAAELTPWIQDHFGGPIGGIRFVRDSVMRVTAFVLNTRGIKGMTFKKSEETHSG